MDFFGTSWNDPKTQAILGVADGLMSGRGGRKIIAGPWPAFRARIASSDARRVRVAQGQTGQAECGPAGEVSSSLANERKVGAERESLKRRRGAGSASPCMPELLSA